jgi:hypothetical protein
MVGTGIMKEYKVTGLYDVDLLEDRLNAVAAEGWRLVHVETDNGMYRIILERDVSVGVAKCRPSASRETVEPRAYMPHPRRK